MKVYQKSKVFEKSLRSGLLFVCFLSVMCVLTGCGPEDKLLSQLRKEEAESADRDADEAESGYAETVEAGADAEGLQGAVPDNDTEAVQNAGQNGSGKEQQGSGQYDNSSDAEGRSGTEMIYVHVCGEVKNPGVYALSAGSRFYEAVEAAGGFTEDASQDYLNMAGILADGSRLEIPAAEAVAGREAYESEGGKSDRDYGEAEYRYYTLSEEAASASAGAGNTSDGLVNINTADIAGLCALPGVGEGRAKAIIEYREKQGGFQKKEDIMQVSGIGEKMYARMKDYLTVE